jgi:glycerol uptake facilitator-like aquaporin
MHLVLALVVAFIGAFALVFIGAGAAVASDPGNFVAIAFAHGFVIVELSYRFGKERSSCLNPAHKPPVLMAGEGSFAAADSVLLDRFAGGTSGGLARAGVYGLHAGHSTGMSTVNLNVTSLAGGHWLEAIGTFPLVTVFRKTALRDVAGKLASLARAYDGGFSHHELRPRHRCRCYPPRTLGPAMGSGKMIGVIR